MPHAGHAAHATPIARYIQQHAAWSRDSWTRRSSVNRRTTHARYCCSWGPSGVELAQPWDARFVGTKNPPPLTIRTCVRHCSFMQSYLPQTCANARLQGNAPTQPRSAKAGSLLIETGRVPGPRTSPSHRCLQSMPHGGMDQAPHQCSSHVITCHM